MTTVSSTGQQKDRTALILFGSETGNSEEIAHQLGCILERLHFTTRVLEMNAVEINALLNHSLVLFTVSTAGQGEFPRNAQKLWKSFLRKSLSHGCLNGVSFTSFGLGDSSYPKFNISARKLHKRLLQLGATVIYPPGESDDQHPEGIDGTFLSWSFDIQKKLLTQFPLPEGLVPISPEVLLPFKHHLEIDHKLCNTSSSLRDLSLTENDKKHSNFSEIQSNVTKPGLEIESDSKGDEDFWALWLKPQIYAETKKINETHIVADVPIERTLPPTEEHIHPPLGHSATLRVNNRITPDDHFQDVRELIFTLNGQIHYQPGDTIVIYPKNFPKDVDHLIDLMEWQSIADKPLKFMSDYQNYSGDEWLASEFPHLHPIPHSTLRQLLTHNLDITAVPTRRFFEVIAHFTENSAHRERLLEFANPIFIDEFYDYTTRPRRNLLEVLEDFSSVRLPWRYIISIFPVIRGRAYSIASGGSQKYLPLKADIITTITILVAIVKYRTVLKRIRQGLCSRYLASLKINTTVRVEMHGSKSFYHVARKSPQLPLILVAPGTGIAPCRSLILEREDIRHRPNNSDENPEIGDQFLFFGGRNRNADFFYEQDWKAQSVPTFIYTAFSRDQKEKIYVQDMIRQNGPLIAGLILKKGAIIYVCGRSGRMPNSVREAFISALTGYEQNQLKLPFTRETAEQKLDEMAKTGYYIQETW